MAKKRRHFLGRFILFILLLAVIYVALGALDFLGVFVMGTYKSKEVASITAIERELKFNGQTDKEDMTWRAYGNEIIFYDSDGNELYKGTIQNGVITYQLLDIDGADIHLYKNGDSERDLEKKSFVDYFRIVLKPVSSLFGKIIDKH